jgi:hypothetical protein
MYGGGNGMLWICLQNSILFEINVPLLMSKISTSYFYKIQRVIFVQLYPEDKYAFILIIVNNLAN